MAVGLQAVMIAMLLSDAVRSQSENGWKFPGSSSSGNSTSVAKANETSPDNSTTIQGRNININILTNPNSDGFIPFPNQMTSGGQVPQITINGFDPNPRPVTNFGDPNAKYNPYGPFSAFNPSKNFLPPPNNFKGYGASAGNFNPFLSPSSFKPGMTELKPSGSSSFSGFAPGFNSGLNPGSGSFNPGSSSFNPGSSGNFGPTNQFGTKFGESGSSKFGSGVDTAKLGEGSVGSTGKFGGLIGSGSSSVGSNKFGNNFGSFQPNPGFIPPNFGPQCSCVQFYLCKAQDVVFSGPNLIDQRSANKNISFAAPVEIDDTNSTEAIAADSNGTLFRSKREDGANDTITNSTEGDISGRSFRPFPGPNVLPGGFPQPGPPPPGPPGRPITHTPGCPPMQVCCRNSILPPPIPGPNQPRPGHPIVPKCGVRNLNGVVGRVKNPNLVEGETQFGEFPWQGAVLRREGKERMYVCGATLLTPTHVLTAAHCVHTMLPVHLKVRLGEWDVSSNAEFYPYVELNVAEIRIHPQFYPGNLQNDIAVLRLEFPVDFTKFPQVSPVCLPPRFQPFTGGRCIVTGWGKDAFGFEGQYQNILKQVDLPVLDNIDCQNRLRHTRLGPTFNLLPGFMCAGGEPGKDACKGDGGSPLVCETEHGYVVAGLVSWGIGCGHPNIPGVYVRVSDYIDWIKLATAY